MAPSKHSRAQRLRPEASAPVLTEANAARRRFLRLSSASAAALALQACGGGGGSPAPGPAPAPPPALTPAPAPAPAPSAPPVWSLVPTLTFTQGTPASVFIGSYAASQIGGRLAIGLGPTALPAGVSYNPQTQSFDYDGVGAVGSVDGVALIASDI